MTPQQEAADAAAVALQKYRESLARVGFAESDSWILTYFKVKGSSPDYELAAIVRAVIWARDSKGGKPSRRR